MGRRRFFDWRLACHVRIDDHRRYESEPREDGRTIGTVHAAIPFALAELPDDEHAGESIFVPSNRDVQAGRRLVTDGAANAR
jgi:hypothetical protein